jgi:hypothetical protein
MHGAAMSTTFLPLAAEAHAGDTTLKLSQAVTGWNVGDRLFLPDTRDLDWNQRGDSKGAYVPEWENVTVKAISADGLTITLSAPLQFDHFGAHDASGTLRYLPDVADLTRNVMVNSASATGTRGQVMFTYRANVDIEYVSFGGLGRTQISAEDDTTYDANGNVTHVGTNQYDRFPVNFHHLMGPTTAQANGYQYTFIGNMVTCPLNPMPFMWGITIDDSHYGLIQDNIVDNWAGSGIAMEQGNESYNVLDHNFVTRINGSGNRMDTGHDGLGYWIHSGNNYVRNNVATDINPGGIYSYGFNIDLYYVELQAIPAFQGADMSSSSQTKTIDMNATALLQFENNTVYGATPNGLTFWWLNALNNDPLNGQGSLIKNFTVWNNYQWGLFAYQSKDLVIDGFTDIGDAAIMAEGNGATGFKFQDYYENHLTVTNGDFENLYTGIEAPVFTDGTTFTVTNTVFRNQLDVAISTPWTVGYSADSLKALTLVFRDDIFDLSVLAGATAFDWGYPAASELTSGETLGLTVPEKVYVYNYNRVAGDNFELFATQQAANFVVPQSIMNDDGTHKVLGAPVAGLTNQEAWAQYGIAIFGGVAPSTATTRTGINGLVNRL